MVSIAMLSRRNDLDLQLLLASDHDCRPWMIPTASNIEGLSRAIGREGCKPPQYMDQAEYRLSAASVAIRFLEGLRVETRSYIQTICLKEDCPSVAWPQCHVQGPTGESVTSYERRLSLWSNVFRQDAEQLLPWGDADHNKLNTEIVSRKYLAPWTMEALALPSLGMPSRSFISYLMEPHWKEVLVKCSTPSCKETQRGSGLSKLGCALMTSQLNRTTG